MAANEVLIISPSDTDATLYLVTIQAAGYSACTVKNLTELRTFKVDSETSVAIIKGGRDDHRSLIQELHKSCPAIQIILISEPLSVQATMQASREGCFWVLPEPFEVEDLLYLVARGVIASQLLKDNTALREALQQVVPRDDLIANSPIMQHLVSRLQRITALDATVLLTGESGTGKTLIGSFIHRHSPRAQKPFISVNCANLPRDLVESELFGHEKGAFTGAHQSRPGTIELCDGGTLLLDEIGELPLELQPKLLTFLQDKAIRRVGGKVTKQVDVRVICATNKNLDDAVSEGAFRQDLFYRINVLSLRIPALRERTGDIPLLCDRILKKISSRKNAGEPVLLSSAARLAVESYMWPGNVRELEHCLERAAAFCDGHVIQLEDLAISTAGAPVPDYAKLASNRELPTGLSLAELEQRYIAQTLAETEGDKALAAKKLGISLKTIYNKLR